MGPAARPAGPTAVRGTPPPAEPTADAATPSAAAQGRTRRRVPAPTVPSRRAASSTATPCCAPAEAAAPPSGTPAAHRTCPGPAPLSADGGGRPARVLRQQPGPTGSRSVARRCGPRAHAPRWAPGPDPVARTPAVGSRTAARRVGLPACRRQPRRPRPGHPLPPHGPDWSRPAAPLRRVRGSEPRGRVLRDLSRSCPRAWAGPTGPALRLRRAPAGPRPARRRHRRGVSGAGRSRSAAVRPPRRPARRACAHSEQFRNRDGRRLPAR